MITTAARALLLAAFLAIPAAASGYSEDEAAKFAEDMKKYRFETVTTKEGLNFSIPSDMPIEKRDGLVQPIPFEEYLYIKFRRMEEKMKALEGQIRGIETMIDRTEKTLIAKLEELKHDPARIPAPPAEAPQDSPA